MIQGSQHINRIVPAGSNPCGIINLTEPAGRASIRSAGFLFYKEMIKLLSVL